MHTFSDILCCVFCSSISFRICFTQYRVGSKLLFSPKSSIIQLQCISGSEHSPGFVYKECSTRKWADFSLPKSVVSFTVPLKCGLQYGMVAAFVPIWYRTPFPSNGYLNSALDIVLTNSCYIDKNVQNSKIWNN